MTKSSNLCVRIVFAACAVVIISGCGGDKKEEKKATQVAAKVDSEEISVHQINAVLAKAQGIPPDRVGEAKREILRKLVDQQLLVNKSVEQKLDRSPEVVMAIEAARKEILARAYVEKTAAGQSKPTAEEVKKYYAEHPQLFGQRKVYNLQELAVQNQEGLLPAVQEKVAASKSLDEVAAWLKTKNLKFSGSGGTRAAEQVPLEMLPKLHETRDGQTLVVGSPQGISIIRVVASQSAPVDEATATPRIQQFLGNQRAQTAITAEMKQLKEKAKIEYMGEFANMSGDEKAKAETPKAPEAPKPKAEGGANVIEKGVAGLK